MRRSKQDQASPRFAFAETLTLSTGIRAEPSGQVVPRVPPSRHLASVPVSVPAIPPPPHSQRNSPSN